MLGVLGGKLSRIHGANPLYCGARKDRRHRHAFQSRLTARLQGGAMYILMVRLTVKQDRIDDFIKASIADGTGSVLHEPGCRRSTSSRTRPTPGSSPLPRSTAMRRRLSTT